jgi:hypothetical protein
MWLCTHPKKRPNTNLRQIDKRTCSWKKRQETFEKKTDMLIQMLKNRTVKYQYQGKDYTLKEICKQFAKKQQRWIAGYPIKGCCLIVARNRRGKTADYIGWP